MCSALPRFDLLPSSCTLPLVGCNKPAMIFSSVDLPLPFSPANPIIFPFGMVKETSDNTVFLPYFFETLSTVIILTHLVPLIAVPLSFLFE